MKESFSAFYDYLQAEDRSQATIRNYFNDLTKFSRWYEETTGEEPDAAIISPLDIKEFKQHLLNRKQKPATINRALATLSVYFSWAQEQGIAPTNPANRIKSLKEERPAPQALDRKEQLALMRAVLRKGKVRDIAIVTLFLHSGLRVSELCRLEMIDITMSDRNGSATVRKGKGEKFRSVPLNPTARAAIHDWLDFRGQEPGPLFLSQKGGGLTTRAVEHLISNYAYDARLENATPHTLRHTFCKGLVDAGVSLDRVASLAGHNNLQTTARYTKATEHDLQVAVDRLAWE